MTADGIARDVADLLEESLTRYADEIAIDTDAGSISYHTLDVNSAALGAALRALTKYAQGATVAVVGNRDIRFVTGVVAVLRAGLRLVTVDPTATSAHIARVVELSGPHVWIGYHTSRSPSGTALDVDGIGRLSKSANDADSDMGIHGDGSHEGSYLFFTSGTSGRPKAVLGRSDSLAQFLEWQRDEYQIGPSCRFGQLTAAGFDVVLRDLLTPLVSGARICLPPADLALGDPRVLSWLAARRITHVHAVPSVVSSWLRGASRLSTPLAALKQIFFAGEPLAGSLVRRVRELAPNVEIANLYGPTETTLAAFAYRVPQDADDAAIMPVGRPRPDVRLGFFDADGQFNSEATSGEVAIRTLFGSNGYVGASREENTRFAFLDNLVTYRTGDAGYLDVEGNLHLEGRLDRQAKINGVRVEPDGIAALIANHPDVTEAVVDVVYDSDRRPNLSAYIVGAIAPDRLRAWLAERVASAQVPSEIRILSRLPLLSNGKVDRMALRSTIPVENAEAPAVAIVSGSLLSDVCNAFTRVLGIAAGPNSDFFELGGDSLDAAVLSQMVQEATSRIVRYVDIFECRTPTVLSERLTARSAIEPSPIPSAPKAERYPLSPQQLRYLRVYLPRENRSWANMPVLWELPAGTTSVAIQRALDVLVARHDSLRAYIFVDPDGSRKQSFVEPRSVPLAVRTVPVGLGVRERQEWLEAAMRSDASRVIDVDAWPLFRATYFEVEGGPRLLWNPHHLISDGQSQNLILRDLSALLAGERLSPLEVSYRDYACWRQVQADGSEAQLQFSYWTEVFAEPFTPLALAANGDVACAAAGRAFQLRLDSSVMEPLADFARGRGVTPFAVVLAAQMVACHALYNSRDVVIGTPAGGRTHEKTSDVVGNFISLVTMRHQIGEVGSFGELVELMHRRTSLAMSHQDFQYDRVMDMVGAPEDDNRFPLTTAFISQVQVPESQGTSALTTGHRDLGSEVKFDLMLYVRECGTETALDLLYRAECLHRAAAEELVRGMVSTILAGMVDPDAPIEIERIDGE